MDSSFIIAVHALVYLNHKNSLVSSEALAENICTNSARVRKVMAKLKKAGMVETKEGNVGGYRFCKDAKTLSLAQIADAMEVQFVSSSWRSGDSDMDCLIASGMTDIINGLYLRLDQQCRKSLQEVTIADIDKKIFS